ncbi:hypothetical protein VNO80_28924 [Phaseolus coccineus]|uniref:Uncharacterized protein n=1 Tax=Phaseolus coccineus TaxID=3886 RepID=A0AAN9LAH2_PHACN
MCYEFINLAKKCESREGWRDWKLIVMLDASRLLASEAFSLVRVCLFVYFPFPFLSSIVWVTTKTQTQINTMVC